MKKYLAVFSISWAGGFIYRLNFIMWRVRIVIQMLTVYFLWLSVLRFNQNAFGYTAPQLLTYVVGTSLIRAFVFSSQSTGLQSDISSGDLNNFLVKPVSILGYWLARDGADKLLNIIFSLVEIGLLYLILRPPLIGPASLLALGVSSVMVILAVYLYFVFSVLISLTVFWIPEGSGWPQRFFIFVMLEFLAGGLFPLDILPPALYLILSKLPPAYMLSLPLQIYLGRIGAISGLSLIAQMIIWIGVLWYLSRWLFQKRFKGLWSLWQVADEKIYYRLVDEQ